MYIQLTETMFKEQFRIMNRLDNFSHAALSTLYDYYEELEDACGPIECDVIAICCEWTEMTRAEIAEQYSEYSDDGYADEIMGVLRDNTTVIDVSGGTYLVQEC